MRARQITHAAKFIYHQNNGIKSILKCFNSSIAARKFFSDFIPGLGCKESSHFLRNIGYCDDLAIIDVHIITFLKRMALINSTINAPLTYRTYRELEKKF